MLYNASFISPGRKPTGFTQGLKKPVAGRHVACYQRWWYHAKPKPDLTAAYQDLYYDSDDDLTLEDLERHFQRAKSAYFYIKKVEGNYTHLDAKAEMNPELFTVVQDMLSQDSDLRQILETYAEKRIDPDSNLG